MVAMGGQWIKEGPPFRRHFDTTNKKAQKAVTSVPLTFSQRVNMNAGCFGHKRVSVIEKPTKILGSPLGSGVENIDDFRSTFSDPIRHTSLTTIMTRRTPSTTHLFVSVSNIFTLIKKIKGNIPKGVYFP
jgi:hypothetical protein